MRAPYRRRRRRPSRRRRSEVQARDHVGSSARRWSRKHPEVMFSKRSAFDAAPNELAAALERRRARGEDVIDLTESNPTRAGIPYDEHEILAALADTRSMRYEPEPFGLPAARETIARAYGVDASRVVLTASTSEAYAFLFALLCDPC